MGVTGRASLISPVLGGDEPLSIEAGIAAHPRRPGMAERVEVDPCQPMVGGRHPVGRRTGQGSASAASLARVNRCLRCPPWWKRKTRPRPSAGRSARNAATRSGRSLTSDSMPPFSRRVHAAPSSRSRSSTPCQHFAETQTGVEQGPQQRSKLGADQVGGANNGVGIFRPQPIDNDAPLGVFRPPNFDLDTGVMKDCRDRCVDRRVALTASGVRMKP